MIIAARKKAKARRVMREVDFSDKIEGDHECKICMSNYDQDSKIIVLECSKLHNFHGECIRNWVEVSPNCPVCRRDIVQ